MVAVQCERSDGDSFSLSLRVMIEVGGGSFPCDFFLPSRRADLLSDQPSRRRRPFCGRGILISGGANAGELPFLSPDLVFISPLFSPLSLRPRCRGSPSLLFRDVDSSFFFLTSPRRVRGTMDFPPPPEVAKNLSPFWPNR